MKRFASAQITGFIESSSAEQGEVVVAGIRFKIKVDGPDQPEIGDLIALNAFLDERGTWHGAITMHLGRPAGLAGERLANNARQEPNPGTSTQPRLQSVQPAAPAPAAVPTPAGGALSRAQRFAQAQGHSSPRNSPAPTAAPPAATETTARPRFNAGEDFDQDIPF